MLRIHIAGNELGALTHHFRQNRFAAPTDERDVAKLNHTPRSVPVAANFIPCPPQFSRPLADQLAL